MKTKELKRNKGITLIALVITIIILLILAGVTIATLTGENGILTKATEARNTSEYAGAREAVEAEVLGSFDNKGNYDANKAKENLEKNLGATVILNPDGTLDVYYQGYHFKVSAEGKVTFVGEDEGAETSGVKFKQVSEGDSYTLALDEDGNIWSWGYNRYGYLGNGESGNTVTIPNQVTNETNYTQIVAGTTTAIALDEDGNIWSWGNNVSGQVGNGEKSDNYVTIPTQISNGTRYIQISGGNGHSIALDESGNIWTWGSNYYGQLGNGQSGFSNRVLTPTKITNEIQYTQIKGANDFNFALDSDGNIWSWGYNSSGQLGNGQSGTNVLIPTQVTNGTRYSQISGGSSHGLAIDSEGNIWSWGRGSYGELGNGQSSGNVSVPTQITNGIKYTQISVAAEIALSHNMALDSEGNIWTWGYNSQGELGNGQTGSSNSVSIPTKVTSGTIYTQISAGGDSSLALDNEGNIFGCGDNERGQLTFEQTAMSWVQINVKLSKLGSNGVALDDEGNIWSWKINGDGTKQIPTQITNGTQYIQVQGGSLALDSDGNIWTWGNNGNGQLGNGQSGGNVSSPIQITTGTKYIQIAGGSSHCIALDESGNIWTWGYNNQGQLGNGEKGTNVLVPTKVTSGTKYVQIATGSLHSLALDEEGNIWTWGINSDGQLGNGESGYSNNVLIPTQVTTGTKYIQIEGRGSNSIALDEKGNIWTWGSNSSGQLGNGESGYFKNVVTPTQITNGIQYTKISGGSSCLALDSEGNIWVWGSNTAGELGDGTGANVTQPKKLELGIKVKEIVAGSFILDENGYMWSTGTGASGRNTFYPTFQKMRI